MKEFLQEHWVLVYGLLMYGLGKITQLCIYGMARKVIIFGDGNDRRKNRCPRCKNTLTWLYQGYCTSCGQKLKWN
jgi:hypothetical protein